MAISDHVLGTITGEIEITIEGRAKKGAIYTNNKKDYEFIFKKSDKCIGSISVKSEDLNFIYGNFYYLLKKDYRLNYLKEITPNYKERKDFLLKLEDLKKKLEL